MWIWKSHLRLSIEVWNTVAGIDRFSPTPSSASLEADSIIQGILEAHALPVNLPKTEETVDAVRRILAEDGQKGYM
jgi:hypothetical protein